MSLVEFEDEVQPESVSPHETLAQLRAKRSDLLERSHDLHEESGELDRELEHLRVILDEERAMKQSAVRRLAEKLCNPDCTKIGPLSPKGVVVYERRIVVLKRELDKDELEITKRRQMAIDVYTERIADMDSTLARQNDQIRRLTVKLINKQNQFNDLRLGLQPKSGLAADEQDQVT